MKWHEYRPEWKFLASKLQMPTDCCTVVPAVVSALMRDMPGGNRIAVVNTCAHLEAEAIWTQDDRPYYDLYPSVAEAFTTVDLTKVNCEHIRLPVPVLMIRMPVGHELDLSPKVKLTTALVGEQHVDGRRGLVAACSLPDGDHAVTGMRLTDGTTIQSHLDAGYKVSDRTYDGEAAQVLFRVIATLCLLKGNTDLIEPQPLAGDIDKWNATHDINLIEKAKRRGVRRWAVGKHIEVAPGFRRPHFAIRWMGKGRHDPQLRPIKGCLVRRKQIEDVPTDWLGPDTSVDSDATAGTIHA
jgi:hypothetical protein